jgi:hypothetical protein
VRDTDDDGWNSVQLRTQRVVDAQWTTARLGGRRITQDPGRSG